MRRAAEAEQDAICVSISASPAALAEDRSPFVD